MGSGRLWYDILQRPVVAEKCIQNCERSREKVRLSFKSAVNCHYREASHTLPAHHHRGDGRRRSLVTMRKQKP